MTRPCPICNRPVVWEESADRPFCSERCRMIDLGHWASEDYVVPGEAVRVDDGTPGDDDAHSRNGDL